MEKGALLPIQFYPAKDWTDYEKIKDYSGDVALLKEHILFFPAFQMTMPDVGRHWGIDDFLNGTMEIIDYDTGDIYDMTEYIQKIPIVFNKAGEFRNLVWFRFPTYDSDQIRNLLVGEGRFYYHMADREDETHWYSEVFERCDLGTNIIEDRYFTDQSGWASWSSSSTAVTVREEFAFVAFCKTGAAVAEAFLEDIEVFLGEEIDFYLYAEDDAAPCGGVGSWDSPLYFQLVTADGLVVSDITVITDSLETVNVVLKPTVGGTVRLRMFMEAADTSKGWITVWLQRNHVKNHIQLRYSNPSNFCKIFYEDDYENVFFLDAKQVIDENAIEETVTEDDQTNKYRIIGTNN